MRFNLGLILLILLSSVFAQSGLIPREHINRAATDLVYKGEILLPEEAEELYLSNKKHFDLSDLNPTEDTDSWKNVFPEKLSPSDEELPIQFLETVEFDSIVTSTRDNLFRFNVNLENEFGVPVTYTLAMSKKIHNFLMLKALLEKIGYQLPKMKHLKKVKISFDSIAKKNEFINYIEKIALLGKASNWVVDEFNPTTLIVQDIIALESLPLIYNLAMAPLTSNEINGRRLMSALVIPLALTNVPESVNMLRWNVGQVSNKNVSIQYPDTDTFNASYEDARWISKRIEKLKISDWEEIVERGATPKPVQMLLLQKMLSRRNNLMKLFNVDAKMFDINDKVSFGVELVEGKLTQEKWPGYGSRFAFGDPDSPLSSSEMNSWFKSKTIQTILDAAVSGFNQIPYLGTDEINVTNNKISDYIKDASSKIKVADLPQTIPLKSFQSPSLHGGLILNRSITTGAYLGTDNMVQLVDSIGARIDGGYYIGSGGLHIGKPKVANVSPSTIPIIAGLQLGGEISRTYAHLRPVLSLKKALKYPFKNILVPLLNRKYARHFDELVSSDFESSSDEVKNEKIMKAIKVFASELDIGESIIITDSIKLGAQARLAATMYQFLRLQVSGGVDELVLSRLHIHRRSENMIHIYRDLGEEHKLNVGFNSSYIIPLLSSGFKKGQGHARVKFYPLSIDKESPDIINNLLTIRATLLNSNLEIIDQEKKPFVITHKFNENLFQAGLLPLVFRRLGAQTRFSVKNPSGDSKEFIRTTIGNTLGVNYQDFVLSSIENVVSMFLNFNFTSSNSSPNPGFSFKGKAKNKIVVLDSEILEDKKSKASLLRISRIWNGWQISQEKAKKILEKLKQHYHYEFYEPNVLSDTQKLFLYNISSHLLLYQKGLNAVEKISEKEIDLIFKAHPRSKQLKINPVEKTEEELVEMKAGRALKRFKRLLNEYKLHKEKNNLEKSERYLVKAIRLAELKLSMKGFIKLVGGKENVYVNSRIDGYRVGDEDGDQSIYSNTLGEIGAREVLGNIQQTLSFTEMLEGEFFVYWLMTRLI